MFSIESEQAVLGSLLIDNHLLDELNLKTDDFARQDHKLIFETMLSMSNNRMPFDVISLYSELGDKGQDIGGMGYLGSMVKNTTPKVAEAYTKIIKNKTKLRKLARIGSEIVERTHSNETADEIIDFAQAEVLTLDEDQETNTLTVSEILPSVIDGIEERFNNGGEIVGLPSGFTDLDKKTSGLQGGDLIIIAGRPSMGKTTLATNIARHVAVNGKTALLFSLEMPREQIVNREIAAIGGIEFSHIRNGQIEDHEWTKLSTATATLNNKNLIIDDSSGLSVNQIRSRARREKKKHGLDLIVIDYLQLMANEGESQTHSIELISKGLKNLAKELRVPVIALSQLNRGVDKRDNKRPAMSDLRQSGAIEQDADIILFVYRDEVYNEDSPDKGTAEINIAKQRNGEIGMVRLIFQGNHCRFMNYSGVSYETH